MQDFRKTKPDVRGKITFELPNIEQDYLSNGIRLLYVQKQNLPITQFQILLESGSSYDPEDKKGLSYLTTMLMDEGAAEYSSLQLSEEIEKIGSILSISSDKDCIYASLLSMTYYIERSVELLSKIIMSPNFDINDFDREKAKLLTKIIQTEDNPSILTNNVFDQMVYKNTYYSHPVIGLEDTVQNLNREDVNEFYYNTVLKSKITIVAVGSEPKEFILGLLNKYLSLPKTGAIVLQEPVSKGVELKTKIYLINSDEAPQSEIRIGHLTNRRTDGDFFSKLVMNAVLGGQFSSRINSNLREDKGYTYGASSYFNYNKMSGEFTVSTSVQSEVTTEAVSEIMKELRAIRDGIDSDELLFAKSFLVKRFPSMFETYMQIANNLSTMVLYELGNDYFNNYLEHMNNVQLDDANAASKNYIFPDNSIILINGNKKELLPGLKEKFNYEVYLLDKKGNVIS